MNKFLLVSFVLLLASSCAPTTPPASIEEPEWLRQPSNDGPTPLLKLTLLKIATDCAGVHETSPLQNCGVTYAYFSRLNVITGIYGTYADRITRIDTVTTNAVLTFDEETENFRSFLDYDHFVGPKSSPEQLERARIVYEETPRSMT